VERPAELPAALGDLWRRATTGPAALVVAVAGRAAPVGYPLDVDADQARTAG
jgi:hypothetical protein